MIKIAIRRESETVREGSGEDRDMGKKYEVEGLAEATDQRERDVVEVVRAVKGH